MGFAIAIAAALAVLFALWRTVRERGAIELIAAALLLGCAGYAWQGHPSLAGQAANARAKPAAPRGFAQERRSWLPQVGPDAQVLDAADGLIARGDADYAAGIIRAQLRETPRNALLWLGLANALVSYADGQVTPAARFAFARADAMGGGAPAPRYFLALALAEAGDLDGAERAWRDLLASAAPDAPWRPRIVQKLAILYVLRSRS